MVNLQIRLKKIEQRLNFNKEIDPKKKFKIISKVLEYRYGFDEEDCPKEKISPEEWEWYVNHRYKIAKEKNEDLEKIKKEIEEDRREIEKNGGFITINKQG